MNPLKYLRNRKVGLALGSGGAKGLAHIGVIEHLDALGIPIDFIAGSSIGAVIGALYCTGQLRRFRDDVTNLTLREMLSYVDPVIPKAGLIEGRGFIRFMERYIQQTVKIEDLHPPLAICATDYATGSSVVFRSGSLLDAIRASVSIPGVFVPVRYKDTLLVDGGVANPLPINVVRDMGAGITIAVNLHPRLKSRGIRSYVKSTVAAPAAPVDPSDVKLINEKWDISSWIRTAGGGWFKAIEQWLPSGKKREKRDMPTIFDVIAQTFDIMEYVNTELMLRYHTPTVIIEPNVTDVMSLNFTDAGRIVYEGYMACAAARRTLVRKVKMWL